MTEREIAEVIRVLKGPNYNLRLSEVDTPDDRHSGVFEAREHIELMDEADGTIETFFQDVRERIWEELGRWVSVEGKAYTLLIPCTFHFESDEATEKAYFNSNTIIDGLQSPSTIPAPAGYHEEEK